MLFRHSGWLSEEKLFSAICFPLRFYTAKTQSGPPVVTPITSRPEFRKCARLRLVPWIVYSGLSSSRQFQREHQKHPAAPLPKVQQTYVFLLVKSGGRKFRCLNCDGEDPLKSPDTAKLLMGSLRPAD